MIFATPINDPALVADKFTKSLSNRRTEDAGIALLLADARFQAPDLALRKHIVADLEISEAASPRSFDCVMTPIPMLPLTPEAFSASRNAIRIVEMKTTKKPIKDASLNGFFFGATEREYQLAELLGDQFMFAFVVLNSENVYGRPFAVLLTLAQVTERTKTMRMQYQVNFRSDMDAEATRRELLLL